MSTRQSSIQPARSSPLLRSTARSVSDWPSQPPHTHTGSPLEGLRRVRELCGDPGTQRRYPRPGMVCGRNVSPLRRCTFESHASDALPRQLWTASTDKFGAVWDAETGARIRRLRGHTSKLFCCEQYAISPRQTQPDIINACATSRAGALSAATGSDDGTIKLWDARCRNFLHSLVSKYQVTALTFDGTGEQVVSGGIDNNLKVWDLRKLDIMYEMVGHTGLFVCEYRPMMMDI